MTEQKDTLLDAIKAGMVPTESNRSVLSDVPLTPSVDRMLSTFERQWVETANACIQRAEELEKAAADLRLRAADLHSACNYLQDVKQAVLFEIESRNRATSLALVNLSE